MDVIPWLDNYDQGVPQTLEPYPDKTILDKDGYLFIVDRMKDLIKPSGFQVWPREVEDDAERSEE